MGLVNKMKNEISEFTDDDSLLLLQPLSPFLLFVVLLSTKTFRLEC